TDLSTETMPLWPGTPPPTQPPHRSATPVNSPSSSPGATSSRCYPNPSAPTCPATWCAYRSPTPPPPPRCPPGRRAADHRHSPPSPTPRSPWHAGRPPDRNFPSQGRAPGPACRLTWLVPFRPRRPSGEPRKRHSGDTAMVPHKPARLDGEAMDPGRRDRALRSLFASARALTALGEPDEVLAAIVKHAHDLVGTDFTYLSVIDEKGNLSLRAHEGVFSSAFRIARVPIGTGVGAKVIE